MYNRLERHFLAKMESEEEAIITDPKKAVCVLNSLVEEMGRRLELCKMATARNIVEYNEKFVARRLNPQKGHRYLPYIVVIVDEFADLIMTAKEVEGPVMRLAQKARAVGIHLIIATQRPDVKVITGGIKANFPRAYSLPCDADDRLAHDHRPSGRRAADRPRRHALLEQRRTDAHTVRTGRYARSGASGRFHRQAAGYPSVYLLPDCGMEGG